MEQRLHPRRRRARGPAGVVLAMLTALLTALALSPSASAAPAELAEAGQAEAAAAQVLTWTANDSITAYSSAPATATAGPATIVFENSAATGNTTGMPHTLTFSTSKAGYNTDVTVDIIANPYDGNGGRWEVQTNLSPGKYWYFCKMAGHTMSGELVVTDGGGTPDTTAPEVSATLSGDRDADGAYIGAATVTVSAQDSGSGVASVEYEIDDTGFQPYTTPVVVDRPGDHTVQVRATDEAGNVSPITSTPFTVVEPAPTDTTAPQVTASVTGDKDADGAYVGAATVSLTAQDSGSGVKSVEYALDGGSFTAYDAPVTVSAPGEHTVSYRATDNAGNVSQAQSVTFTVAEPAPEDTTPPTVSAEVTGEKDADGAYVDAATVTLTAQDGGSGVASVEYSLDGAAYAVADGPVTVDQPGEHTVSYRATDNAGNVSEPQSVSFTVVESAPPADTTAPHVMAAVSGDKDADGAYIGAATVTLTAHDAESGVASVEYAVDGGSFTAYDAPVTVDAPGEHTVSFRATDNAGNVSEADSVTFTVVEPAPADTTAPTVSAEVTGEKDADGAYVDAATVTLTAQDGGSGVASVEYSLDGAAYAVATGPVQVTQPGAHTVSYRATDKAGNVSEPQSVSFTVVESAPPAEGECPGEPAGDTVVIDGVDTGVTDHDAGDGCAVSELVAPWADYDTHGAFVSHTAEVVDGLAEDGVLTGRESSTLKRVAARSDIGRPVRLMAGANPLAGWEQAGPGSFSVDEDGVVTSHGGMGLLWYKARSFEEYTLHLDFRLTEESNNSGVFVGFPDVGDDPWVAVRQGEEVQINDNPGGDAQKTGAVYNEQAAARQASKPVGEWNSYDIVVSEEAITVYLNGTQVNHWVDDDPQVDLTAGHLGLQNHPPTPVQFRDVTVNVAGR